MKKSNVFVFIWRVLYPIILYICVNAGATYILNQLSFTSGLGPVIKQGIVCALLVVVMLVSFRQDTAFDGKKNFNFGALLLAMLICIAAGAGLNYIMDYAGSYIKNYSVAEDVIANFAIINEKFTAANLLARIVILGIVVPITEEMMYRGVIFRRLRENVAPWGAIVISSVIFGLLHFNVVQCIYAILMGIFLGVVMNKTDNLVYPICGHATINIFVILSGYFGLTAFVNSLGIWHLIIGIVLVAMAISLAISFCKINPKK